MHEQLVIDRPGRDKMLGAVAAGTTVKSILFHVHQERGWSSDCRRRCPLRARSKRTFI